MKALYPLFRRFPCAFLSEEFSNSEPPLLTGQPEIRSDTPARTPAQPP